MAPIRDGRKFKTTKEQETPTTPTVSSNTSKKTTNLDLDKKTVKDKQTKH
ncbi:hypothetical protein SAMN03097699_1684 [Flavobacteriaceae bacterium MAR_2010_188]|nr:hypothetical protein SAMN03097699_1684 [Flavobacteriaceae bacterium MAR_2010_188]